MARTDNSQDRPLSMLKELRLGGEDGTRLDNVGFAAGQHHPRRILIRAKKFGLGQRKQRLDDINNGILSPVIKVPGHRTSCWPWKCHLLRHRRVSIKEGNDDLPCEVEGLDKAAVIGERADHEVSALVLGDAVCPSLSRGHDAHTKPTVTLQSTRVDLHGGANPVVSVGCPEEEVRAPQPAYALRQP